MNEQRRLIVVDSSVLPEVILKVLDVKKLLASREEKSSASACKRIGISRSAYYKYRDSVFSYDDKMTKRILTLSALLRDEPGILSSVLVTLHACEAKYPDGQPEHSHGRGCRCHHFPAAQRRKRGRFAASHPHCTAEGRSGCQTAVRRMKHQAFDSMIWKERLFRRTVG